MSLDNPYSLEGFNGQSAESEIVRLEYQAKVRWNYEAPLLRSSGLSKGSKIADFGCGPGFITSYLSDEVGIEGEVIGIEQNNNLAEQARNHVQGRSYVKIIQGDVCHLPEIKDDSYDFVYCRFLLQHLGDPRRAMKEAKRILKKSGKLLIMDIDDSLFYLAPYPDYFREFLEEACRGQTLYGGDRYIGHKLACMMYEENFSDINPSVYTFTSNNIISNEFLELTTNFKVELLAPSRRAWGNSILKRLNEDLRDNHFFGTAGIYYVIGTK
jgi:ubiquinone/menaquinone biosynthesis C-methylase UbiE